MWLDDRGTIRRKWMEEVPRRTSRARLASPFFYYYFHRSGTKCTVSRRWFAVKVCDSFTRSNCTQRFFLGNRLRFLCGNDTVAVAMQFAMKNGKICFSLRKFLAISPVIQKIASDCGCDAVVHLGLEAKGLLDFRGRRGIASVVRWNLCPVIFGVETGWCDMSSGMLMLMPAKSC